MNIPMVNNLAQTVNPPVETHKPVSIPLPEIQSMIPLVKSTERGEISKQNEEKDAKSNAGEQNSEDFTDNLFIDTELRISVKEGQTFVKIIDSKTQEIINEIPPEKLVKILSELRRVSGTLFNKKA